jgi:hypothetical protein
MTYWIDGLETTVSIINDIFPTTPCVIGGISATVMADILSKRFPHIRIFSGPVINNNSVFQTIHPDCVPLSTNGWQPSLVDAYRSIDTLSHGPILSSLGCPMKCSYCASSLLQPRFHFRPHATILHEIETVLKLHTITDFAFFDDALLYQPEKHIMPLLTAIIRTGYRINLHAPNGLHIRWIDTELLQLMKKCGFITLRFGYESSDIRYQKETNAKTSRKLLETKIHCMLSAGFKPREIGIYVMGGLPGQSVSGMQEEVRFVASLNVPVKPVFLAPVPETGLFNYYVKEYPQLQYDPLFHNDTFFITQLPHWGIVAVEEIKSMVRELNQKIAPTES